MASRIVEWTTPNEYTYKIVNCQPYARQMTMDMDPGFTDGWADIWVSHTGGCLSNEAEFFGVARSLQELPNSTHLDPHYRVGQIIDLTNLPPNYVWEVEPGIDGNSCVELEARLVVWRHVYKYSYVGPGCCLDCGMFQWLEYEGHYGFKMVLCNCDGQPHP